MSTSRSLERSLRYLITFSCYGSRLHGAEAGAVDRKHSVPGTRFVVPNAVLEAMGSEEMDQPPYSLDRIRRGIVLEAVGDVCAYRGWDLLAAHVRTNHVHVVVETAVAPEKAMHAFKAYASRKLNELGCDAVGRKRWARHGSTRWLWKDAEVRRAVEYVVRVRGRLWRFIVRRGCGEIWGLEDGPLHHCRGSE